MQNVRTRVHTEGTWVCRAQDEEPPHDAHKSFRYTDAIIIQTLLWCLLYSTFSSLPRPSDLHCVLNFDFLPAVMDRSRNFERGLQPLISISVHHSVQKGGSNEKLLPVINTSSAPAHELYSLHAIVWDLEFLHPMSVCSSYHLFQYITRKICNMYLLKRTVNV